MTNLKTMWRQAATATTRTPANRNRYADALRALAILAVVIGHWVIAAPYVKDGSLLPINLLAEAPPTQYLTWLFQVMPVFFVVGGFANAASLQAAQRDGTGRFAWLRQRARRLILPAAPLVAAWALAAIVLGVLGVSPSLLRTGSQAALIPLWFLAVYLLVVTAAPWLADLWDRLGYGSIASLAAAAVVVDLAAAQQPSIGYLNFFFVWATMHQIGFAWHGRRMPSPRHRALLGTLALATLTVLVTAGPYPLSMVGVPGAVATNNSPPTVALIALGLAQTGFLLAAERPARRFLARPRLWQATVLINGSIMSIYLWHLTALVMVAGAAVLSGGLALTIVPGSPLWWWTRPVWIAVMAMATMPLVLVASRFERRAARPARRVPSRLFGSAAIGLAVVGFSLIAKDGIVRPDQLVQPLAVLPVVAAAGLLREA